MNIKPSKILITGGAGFIGSNLVDYFLNQGHEVVCLDNLVTGLKDNIANNMVNKRFHFIQGDIRDIETCKKAIKGCNYVLHHAALGSVPRSTKDPIGTTTTNINGFLNILISARDEQVIRFIYAASSSTYGDSKKIPKIESEIGEPLSTYGITKYANELYANVFASSYGMQCIGLRYFNVFGRRQLASGAYAAVIPIWVKKLMKHQQPIINGNKNISRDFTYIDNVIHANEQALFIDIEELNLKLLDYYNINIDNGISGQEPNKYVDNKIMNLKNNSKNISEIFNIAYGGNTTLQELFNTLKLYLSKYDNQISKVEPIIGPYRSGDIPHSKASIEKATNVLNYIPKYDPKTGFKLASKWYFDYYNHK